MGKDYSEFIMQLQTASQIPIRNIVREVKEHKSGAWLPADFGVSGNPSDTRNLPGPHAKHWHMTYAEGLDAQDGLPLRVSVDNEGIYLEPEHGSRLWRVHLSTSDIVHVWNMPLLLAPIPQFYDHPGPVGDLARLDPVSGNYERFGGPFSIDPAVVREAALNPDILATHLVRITWKHGTEGSREFFLRVRLKDRQSFLNQIGEATGTPWKDMRYDRIEEESSDAAPARHENTAQ